MVEDEGTVAESLGTCPAGVGDPRIAAAGMYRTCLWDRPTHAGNGLVGDRP